MLWSFSRDGGVPLYRVWAAINKYTGTPLNATWAMSALAFLIGLPMLLSNTAFIATGALSSVGLYVSCECSALFCCNATLSLPALPCYCLADALLCFALLCSCSDIAKLLLWFASVMLWRFHLTAIVYHMQSIRMVWCAVCMTFDAAFRCL